MKNDENPEDSRNEIPEMKLDNKYSDKKPGISEMSEMQKEMEKRGICYQIWDLLKQKWT